MLYPLDLSPVALVRLEADKINMTAAEFLNLRSPVTGPGKRRLCYHLHVERDMPLVDVAHWIDKDHTTVSFHVRNFIKLVLKRPLRRRCRTANLAMQPDTPPHT